MDIKSPGHSSLPLPPLLMSAKDAMVSCCLIKSAHVISQCDFRFVRMSDEKQRDWADCCCCCCLQKIAPMTVNLGPDGAQLWPSGFCCGCCGYPDPKSKSNLLVCTGFPLSVCFPCTVLGKNVTLLTEDSYFECCGSMSCCGESGCQMGSNGCVPGV